MNLAFLLEVIAALSFIGAITKYLIVTPLQQSIDTLKEAIIKLDMMLTTLNKEHNDVSRRLVVVEESAKAAHKRLDGFEHKHE